MRTKPISAMVTGLREDLRDLEIALRNNDMPTAAAIASDIELGAEMLQEGINALAVAKAPRVRATCPRHGRQTVVQSGEAEGFTGGPIFWANLECGCHLTDLSHDTIGRVK